MAIGKESIMRAVNANNITKDSNVAFEKTQTEEKPISKEMNKKSAPRKPKKQVNKTIVKPSNQVISNIKSDLPTYLL